MPWVVKPLYGMVSDFLPLFGYRRRSYLLLANAGAVAAFVWAAQALAPAPIIFALVLTCIAMAISSTVCGALLVENGELYGVSAAFINQQWLWFNVAAMAGSLLGGLLIEYFSAAGALHAAAACAAVAPIVVLASSIALLHERRAGMDARRIQSCPARLPRRVPLAYSRLIGAFLFCDYFSPGFGTPLYFHMTDELHFSAGPLGVLASVSAGGWIVGGLLYRFVLRRMPTRALLKLSILAGVLATLAYLGMVDEPSAITVYFLNGVAGMVANIATLALAAEHCPPRSEGFAFAALMSVINLATALADPIGAYMFEHWFNRGLAPLIIVSAAFTALIFVLVPLLDRGLTATRSAEVR